MSMEMPGALRFAGYASVFDKIDHGGDIVRRGAFSRAISAGGGGLPLLWQHDEKQPIGRIEKIEEDARGLRVIGRITRASHGGQDAAALVGEGAVSGLSIGYRPVRAARRRNGARELTDLDLIEISLVTFPMQPLARVHAVAEG